MPIVTKPASQGAIGFIPDLIPTGGLLVTPFAVESSSPAIRTGDVLKYSTAGIATLSSISTGGAAVSFLGFSAMNLTTSNFDGITQNLLAYTDPNVLYVCTMTSSEILLSSGVGSYFGWITTTGGASTQGGGTPTFPYSRMTIQSTPITSTGDTHGYLQLVAIHPLTMAARVAGATGVSSSAAGATGYLLVKAYPGGVTQTISS